ncbi:UBX domain-containing protein 6 [Phalaenopsis equestris]|uniref:UBX domain-containing protein 6 n=1 Tax=Phalaenopsis equestris TaxID=78828 RepID=UPI0009E228E3|nr:UBX domain-containing protein 6 [Phalaenopsis equestris]
MASPVAGLSLRCGDCGTLLRSVEEAQEHADLTSHANFSESTEAVLNLICNTCGKPCRSKTESDLHTKRTGHADFTDKTLEAAKPIDLEASKPPAVNSEGNATVAAAVASESGQSDEMIIPEVDKRLLEELELMGFATARATRALHYSGNSSIEAAINWVADHEDDPDVDQMPLVSINSSAETSKKTLTAEEIKIKAEELRERARKKKDEEEKRMEREREKDRIRVGKELLAAKRIEEDNERKRIIELRKAEKEEEKRAREKIRQRLEEDKAERRRKLGLPPEDPVATKPATTSPVEEKSALPIKPVIKLEQMRDCLRSLKQNHKEDDAKVKRAFQTLLTYVGNVARNPNEEKFRKIRLNNATFQDRVGSLHGGVEFLQICGFEKQEGGEFLFLPRDKVDIAVMNSAGSELNSAITNPFFGIL